MDGKLGTGVGPFEEERSLVDMYRDTIELFMEKELSRNRLK